MCNHAARWWGLLRIKTFFLLFLAYFWISGNSNHHLLVRRTDGDNLYIIIVGFKTAVMTMQSLMSIHRRVSKPAMIGGYELSVVVSVND